MTAPSTNPPLIDQNVIGTPVSGFGRYIGTSASDRRIAGEDGVTYRLDGLSARFVELGDHIYFEGIRGSITGGATNVTSSTGRYAFHCTGRVVLENGVKVAKSDQLLFDDTFRAPGLDSFLVGEKALYTNDIVNGWGVWAGDNPIWSGGTWGTARGGTRLIRDRASDSSASQDNRWDHSYKCNPDRSSADFGSPFSGGVNFVFGDGSVRAIPFGSGNNFRLMLRTLLTPKGSTANASIE